MKYERVRLEDKIRRNIGIIKYAKLINSIEVTNLLSMLQLGVDLNLLQHIEKKEIIEIIVQDPTAHLQK